MSYFDIIKYTDNLYQIKDKLGVLSTLVIGSKKALLFDTCYGIGDLKAEVMKLTNKELIVVNSHGHMDHTGGNYQFEQIYLHQNDFDLVRKHNSLEWRKRNLDAIDKLKYPLTSEFKSFYLSQREGNIIPLDINKVFDLGNLECLVLPIYGHTKGSIAIYIEKWNLALVSDGTCPFVWLFLEESTTISEYISNLTNLCKYNFDKFLVGHGARMLPKKRMYDFLNIAREIDITKAIKVSFTNFENMNSYCYSHDKLYDQDGCGIVFDPNKM